MSIIEKLIGLKYSQSDVDKITSNYSQRIDEIQVALNSRELQVDDLQQIIDELKIANKEAEKNLENSRERADKLQQKVYDLVDENAKHLNVHIVSEKDFIKDAYRVEVNFNAKLISQARYNPRELIADKVAKQVFNGIMNM